MLTSNLSTLYVVIRKVEAKFDRVKKYVELRVYVSDNLCENIPEGHDPEMWRLYNDCQ